MALIAALMLGGLAHGAPAQNRNLPRGITDVDSQAIRDMILGQIFAFERDDAKGAFRYAAPNVRRTFPNPDQFLAMVQRDYPQVYRPQFIDFAGLTRHGRTLRQEVELVGPDNTAVTATYTIIAGPKGGWLIAGVSVKPSERVRI